MPFAATITLACRQALAHDPAGWTAAGQTGMTVGAIAAAGAYLLAVRRVHQSRRLTRRKRLALYVAMVPLAALVFVGVGVAAFFTYLNW